MVCFNRSIFRQSRVAPLSSTLWWHVWRYYIKKTRLFKFSHILTFLLGKNDKLGIILNVSFRKGDMTHVSSKITFVLTHFFVLRFRLRHDHGIVPHSVRWTPSWIDCLTCADDHDRLFVTVLSVLPWRSSASWIIDRPPLFDFDERHHVLLRLLERNDCHLTSPKSPSSSRRRALIGNM